MDKAIHFTRPTIDVTQKDIDIAIRKDSGHCMVAYALKRSLPSAKTVSVEAATIRYTDSETGNRYVWFTPRHIGQLLIAWDYGVNPGPFKFQLRTLLQLRPKSVTAPTVGYERKLHVKGEKHGFSEPGPILVGGPPLPRAPRPSRRRQFGIRTPLPGMLKAS